VWTKLLRPSSSTSRVYGSSGSAIFCKSTLELSGTINSNDKSTNHQLRAAIYTNVSSMVRLRVDDNFNKLHEVQTVLCRRKADAFLRPSRDIADYRVTKSCASACDLASRSAFTRSREGRKCL
jgi:hypothetical protein